MLRLSGRQRHGRSGEDPAVPHPVAIVVLLLTTLRIVWWRFDRKPLTVQVSSRCQDRIPSWIHVAFYVVILGMVAGGIGMMV
ncbi:hypothetical protein QN219_33700 [Sinorhizobium sp. 7-81]|uniref:hypothetical protein n=1 Tax=Sinorhizobium sp. 8-89 TaxID=3049089 RepID=UPI0024C27765|nr:hypothetical protein [Sinorhizobium sp. 8-89]MDK1494848.1 hypothetical protein [Sinorhizobium sp. 8-89]